MRILITGSRAWSSASAIMRAMANSIPDDVEASDVTIVHGGARGADTMADQAARYLGYAVEEHPAHWDSCGPDCGRSHWRYRSGGEHYCARAGFVRNAEMVDLGADLCLAFYAGPSRGTDMCASLAEKAGILVHRFTQEE